jgi:glutathione S-transferase
MNDIISNPYPRHTATPGALRTRIGRLAALAPDQIEAGLTWLAGRHPDIFDAVMAAALNWDDRQVPSSVTVPITG